MIMAVIKKTHIVMTAGFLVIVIIAVLSATVFAAPSISAEQAVISNELVAEFHVNMPPVDEDFDDQESALPDDTQLDNEEITVVVDAGDGLEVSSATIQRSTQPDGTKKDEVTFGFDQAKQAADLAAASGQGFVRIVMPDAEDIVS